jgi:Zn-finger nucleic acid-binding protein
VALPCPRCPSAHLTERSVIPSSGGASTNVHQCDACKGVWLDGTTLTAICPTVAHLPEHKHEVALSGERGGGITVCPRCRVVPYQFVVLSVPIDFCLQCQGVWLDGDEYEESMLDGEARPAPRGGAYRQAGNRVARDEIKCVDCGAQVPIKHTFMREHGHTCLTCNSRREIHATEHRAAVSTNAMRPPDLGPTPEQFHTPLDAIVKAISTLFGKSSLFR